MYQIYLAMLILFYLSYRQTRAKEKGIGTKKRGVDQTRQKQGSYYGQCQATN